MKNIFRFSIVLLFTALMINFPASAQMFGSMNISGHVYAAGGEDSSPVPIDSAVVTLKSFMSINDSASYSDTTDASGAFSFRNVRRGMYMLSCNANGYASLVIKQFEIGDDSHDIRLYLHDTTSVQGGWVTGKVDFDRSMLAVMHAVIEFINTDTTGSNYFATTNFFGQYKVKLPAGSYYASCSVFTADSSYFFQVFYPDAQSIADAKAITVNDGQVTDDIDFEVPEHVVQNQTHSVAFSGNVTATDSAGVTVPLANATVKVWSIGRYREHEVMEHGNGALLATAQTDALGNYSITLDSLDSSFHTFIVAANKNNYHIQFYNGESNAFKADQLYSFGDTAFTGINFNLLPVDTQNSFSLSGTVTDTAGNGLKNIFVIATDSLSGRLRLAVSDSLGAFQFQGLKSGSYYLMFFAGGYIAQYYNGVYKWENATAIKVNGDVSGITAVMRTADTTYQGGGQIIGQVHAQDGTELSGALVTVSSSGGSVIGTAVTDNTGSYSVSGLIQGQYSITVSLSQYSSQQTTTSYNPSNGSTSVSDFTMPSSKVTSVETPVAANSPSSFVLENNYPNPFNPSTVISFVLPQMSHVRLDVYNILGQKITELVNSQLPAGNYKVTFDGSNLSSGIYFYRLDAGNFTMTKKMILNK